MSASQPSQNVQRDLWTCHDCGKQFKRPGSHRGSESCRQEQLRRNLPAPHRSTPPSDSLAKRLSLYRQRVPVLRRIPKGARNSIGEALNSLVRNAAERNDVSSWENLLTFSYRTLAVPSKEKKGEKKCSLSSKVRKNIGRLEVVLPAESSPRPRDGNDRLRKAVTTKLEDGNITGAMRLLASDDSLAPFNDETLQKLREKHPPAPADYQYARSAAPTPLISVDSAEVFAAVKSFPNGSAGGLDGIRPSHLKDLLAQSSSCRAQLAESLARLADVILTGQIPREIRPILFGASLTALKKKDGGIRPIAVGSTLRRVVCKVVCRRELPQISSLLSPLQVGCGVRGGAEAAVHGVRCFLHDEPDGRVLLKLDFKNAFNVVRRDRLLDEANKVLPNYVPFPETMYGDPSHLAFGEDLLPSECGVQQGDPLGPLLFCLLAHGLVTSMHAPLNVWYLDDGTIGGSPDVTLTDLSTVISSGKQVGLELNFAKCELFFTGEVDELVVARFDALAPGIQVRTMEDLSLLGAPPFSQGVPSAVASKRAEFSRVSEQLSLIPAHQGLFLLRSCVAVPKMLYVLRTSLAWEHADLLEAFDADIKRAIERITCTALTSPADVQAFLPVAAGGLGIRKLGDLALPAYLSSVHSVEVLLQAIYRNASAAAITTAAVTSWESRSAALPPVYSERRHQSSWDQPIVERSFSSLLEQLSSPADQARLKAVSSKLSSSWLNALPVEPFGNLLLDSHLRIAVALRLGLKMVDPHKCRCGVDVNPDGHHGLSCRLSAGRHSRHGEVNEVVKRALTQAGFQAIREPPGLSPDANLRPDGLTQIPWRVGRSLIWDVTVVDTCAPSYVAESAKRAGHAASLAEERKRAKYRSLLDRYEFLPLAFETLGTWGEDAKKFVDDLGGLLNLNTGEARSAGYLRQRISIALQRGNAISVLGTFPFSEGLHQLFYLV